ncbi:MAG: DUF190 domain-containing protein [Deinococcus sp.]
MNAVLRLYVLAGDRLEGRPLARVVVDTARSLRLPWAFARPGIAGYGRHGLEVDLMLLETRPDRMPMTVQVSGSEAQLTSLLHQLQERGFPDRTVVLEPVETSTAGHRTG